MMLEQLDFSLRREGISQGGVRRGARADARGLHPGHGGANARMCYRPAGICCWAVPGARMMRSWRPSRRSPNQGDG